MSLTLALQAAVSGLKASQQQAALVSRNIANAATPGYVRKDLMLVSYSVAGDGQGVRVTGVGRGVDEYLIRDVRHESSRQAGLEIRLSALNGHVQVHGQPQESRSVASKLSRLQTAFQRLADLPENESVQQSVVSAAGEIAQGLNDVHRSLDQARADTGTKIEQSVRAINDALRKVEEINRTIAQRGNTGTDSSDLLDRRDGLLDEIAQHIGIRTFTRDEGEVVVMTRGGVDLLEGTARTLSIAPGGQLQVDGTDISLGTPMALQTGRLEGLLTLRDDTLPRFQRQADELAKGLILQFQSRDPTLVPVAAWPPADVNDHLGLFTDAGLPLWNSGAPVVGNLEGLAGRIAVNDRARTEPWRVRDGLNAAAPGPSGDTSTVVSFLSGLTDQASFDAAAGLGTPMTLGDFASALVAHQHGERASVQLQHESRTIAANTLQSARMNHDGVNTDDEMQKLLLIEQSYAASAQVIQAAARMIEQLLEI